MARGIIVAKPGSGTAGRIMVTDPSGGADGTGGTTTTTTTGADGTTSTTTAPPPAALSVGKSISFTENCTANLGDVINFNIDANGNGAGISVFKAGRFIGTDTKGNITINAGESVLLAAHLDGKVIINGGMFTVNDGSQVDGKVDASGDGAYVFISGSRFDAKIAVNGASYLGIQNSTVEGAVVSNNNIFAAIINTTINGRINADNAKQLIVQNCKVDGKVSSNGGAYTSVSGCTIGGKLEVVNVTTCACSNNTSCKTNTPGCTA